MGISLFEVLGGFTDGNISYLSGAGLPSGVDADAAGRGSSWSDTSTGDKYHKFAVGAGVGNWVRSATVADIAGIPSTNSWREPVLVLDSVTTSVTAALTAMNTSNNADGVAVAAGDRILFTAFTGADAPNVYIVGGATGAWSLTEDTNATTAGDRLMVINGTYANQEWLVSNAGVWMWIGQQSSAEDVALRNFIGKAAAGTEMPAYTSTVTVANGDSLETAIGKLDAALNNVSNTANSNSAAITSNTNLISAITSGAGLSAAGAYVANAASTYLTTATSLKNADDLLDAALATVASTQTAIITSSGFNTNGTFPSLVATNYLGAATNVVQSLTLLDTEIASAVASITAVNNKVGTATWLGTGYVDGATNLTNAVALLDAAISSVNTDVSVTTASTNMTLDTVPVDSFAMATWKVIVEDSANAANRESFTIDALHNGTTVADANAVDGSRYGKNKVGTEIAGLSVDVVLNGTGATQVMQIAITAGIPVVARCRRQAI